MLAPVPPRRPTGKSSFRKLHSYLAEGVDPETGEVTERGEFFLSPALMSMETAAKEMHAVAAENPRVKDPVQHFILSWQEGEQPSREQWQEAVTHSLDALGWKDHQWAAVAHGDTDNFHVHIMVNKVHPETYRSHSPEWMHKTLDKCCREIEARQGWAHSNGLYRWDAEARAAVPVPREEREAQRQKADAVRADQGAAGTGKAGKMEQFGDAESLQTYAKGAPAKALDSVMKRDGATWQDVHAALARHGLELQKGERGGYTVRATTERGEQVQAKASDVFRKHFAGKAARAATEGKLGDWQAPAAFVRDVAKTEQRYDQHRETRREWKRDPERRQERREERAKERADLKRRFTSYKADHFAEQAKARKADAEDARAKFAALSAESRRQREAIRDAGLSPELRKVARSVAAAEAMQAREKLREELAAKRQEKARPMDYRTWLVVQASQNDKAAEAQLRGFAYQDGRKAAQEARETRREVEAAADKGKPEEQRQQRRAAVPEAVAEDIGRSRRAVALRMSWEIDQRSGSVHYAVDGQRAFTDRGSKIEIHTSKAKADEIEAALRLAAQKFGKDLNVTGNAEFKRHAVEVAAMRGLDVKFSDLAMRREYEQLRAAVAEEAKRKGTPPAAPQSGGEALREAYQAVREGDAQAQAVAAKNHPEIAKALAMERAALAFASEKLQPKERAGFMRETRANIERDLAAGKPLPDVRNTGRDRDHSHEQDNDHTR